MPITVGLLGDAERSLSLIFVNFLAEFQRIKLKQP